MMYRSNIAQDIGRGVYDNDLSEIVVAGDERIAALAAWRERERPAIALQELQGLARDVRAVAASTDRRSGIYITDLQQTLSRKGIELYAKLRETGYYFKTLPEGDAKREAQAIYLDAMQLLLTKVFYLPEDKVDEAMKEYIERTGETDG
jgi:hypothetical protein